MTPEIGAPATVAQGRDDLIPGHRPAHGAGLPDEDQGIVSESIGTGILRLRLTVAIGITVNANESDIPSRNVQVSGELLQRSQMSRYEYTALNLVAC